MKQLYIIVKVCIIIAFFYLSYYVYTGSLQKVPLDGDSWDYHIPITYSIINGGFLTANFKNIPLLKNPVTGRIHQLDTWYYPGSSEAINAFFVFFNIPTFSNIFAAIVLFYCCYKLGKTFALQKEYAILFGITIATLNIILRWLNVVSSDTWVGVWFVLSLILLEDPKKSMWYFTKLGFVLGMLVGSKFTTVYFALVLFIFYAKSLFKVISVQRLIALIIPFSIFGLFWYIRNFFVMGNPFYPLPVFGFPGPYLIRNNPSVFVELLRQPLASINAMFGEYHIWMFSIVIALAVLIYKFAVKREFVVTNLHKIFLIGLINYIIFLSFPSNPEPWILVSSLRYSYPAFIPLILGVFVLFKIYKKEEWLGYIALAGMVNVLTMTYYPKLILFYLPVSFISFYFLDKATQTSK